MSDDENDDDNTDDSNNNREFNKIVESVLAFEQDSFVFNLKALLVEVQFRQIQGVPMDTFEFDMKSRKLVEVGDTDYISRTRLISTMLFTHATQYYPQLFRSNTN